MNPIMGRGEKYKRTMGPLVWRFGSYVGDAQPQINAVAKAANLRTIESYSRTARYYLGADY